MFHVNWRLILRPCIIIINGRDKIQCGCKKTHEIIHTHMRDLFRFDKDFHPKNSLLHFLILPNLCIISTNSFNWKKYRIGCIEIFRKKWTFGLCEHWKIDTDMHLIELSSVNREYHLKRSSITFCNVLFWGLNGRFQWLLMHRKCIEC